MITSKRNKGENIVVSLDERFRLKEGDSASTENFKVTLDRISVLENSRYTVKTRVYFILEYNGKTFKMYAPTQEHQAEKMYPIGVNPTIGGVSVGEYDIAIEGLDLSSREIILRISKNK